ncbi:DNA adenine methylase [Rhodoferax sp. GW822-FHT02A01]|uniref:DNA adenine methylase n=1 Tax=Rhodoferax sp. GW822-FHT02A01 TaxID=3141537 RepID=UPI00315C83CF
MDLNALRGAEYFEPYAGGAGAALSLLVDNVVSHISINDADWRIYSFWKTVLDESAWFVEKIMSARLDLNEWRAHREVCLNPSGHSMRDVGFSAFYMNRCNRSGVLNGGPIGGYEQKGEWRLDVRFMKPALSERVLELAKVKDCVSVSNDDAVDFLKSKLPKGIGRKRAFVYLDPPYVVKGQRLYMNAYEPNDHGKIARYVGSQKILPWVMSYDDAELVRDLYKQQQIGLLPINYSLQEKRSANELVIAPHHVRLPRTLRIGARKFVLTEVNSRIVA